jgi:hypothetical protein
LFLPRPRTFQRTSYRPGVFCQFDLWEPSREIAVGAGQTRRGYVVIGCLPYSRAGAGVLLFSKEPPDLLYGVGECLRKLGGLPETLVWDREGALRVAASQASSTTRSSSTAGSPSAPTSASTACSAAVPPTDSPRS